MFINSYQYYHLLRHANPLQSPSKSWYLDPVVISSITALIIALGIIERIKNIIFRSQLIALKFESTPQGSQFSGRIKIRNNGFITAKGVKVEVEEIKDNSKIRKNYISCPLGWTHIQTQQTYPAERDIYTAQTVYLDIFDYYAGNVPSITLNLLAGRNITNFSNINKGKTELTLRFYQEDGQTNILIVNIDWSGKSDPKVMLKMK